MKDEKTEILEPTKKELRAAEKARLPKSCISVIKSVSQSKPLTLTEKVTKRLMDFFRVSEPKTRRQEKLERYQTKEARRKMFRARAKDGSGLSIEV